MTNANNRTKIITTSSVSQKIDEVKIVQRTHIDIYSSEMIFLLIVKIDTIIY